MQNDDHRADLDWRGNVPVSRRFDDPYFSLEDGPAETEHTFLAGNDLPARFRDGFHIAELGFGTGLNALCAWASFRTHATGTLRFTTFEAYPMSKDERASALDAFPALAELAEPFLAAFDGVNADLPSLKLRVIHGDARETLPRWDGHADAWFLDGFAPAKNPELWAPDLMAEVARHTVPGGSFATYTAAGAVRRALADAGFTVTRSPGYGRKRHMSCGVLS
ncbi:tRNA (5-methylaminomethyl-2-thiouridine)(34)-methyltransferase MnmD [Palleronia caenipelagi]|uniref:tRNA (5-methylaminomethyl-2-thiouridine)(34)-methyltransferase MnmD n=1 Tax=Palleronia caenipelagi TaxID=2489174 RepID=A0A547Q702_9RHOB|nr:tRNA (5-methylaminomethyl-2-thiouridine)(34)-methyltransferase MnmD [Palleronia caenipelagi]TRD22166.1 tRNA (5-methylaminomethyl-2-thiouridine)(34)-methyltransferase MnmD [Palleronia caenipelagi]